MKLSYQTLAHWPPLAWLAQCTPHQDTVHVYHGALIEAKDDWFCEAIWYGDFPAGDFDKTDIVAGSGARVRDNELCFVSSASHLDRLNLLRSENATIVSNSLICLLAWVDGDPELDHLDYTEDFADYRYTIFGNRTLNFRSTAGAIEMTYFANLLWNGANLLESEKPIHYQDFDGFNAYLGYMQDTLSVIASNAADNKRKHPFKFLCALSNGYDSPTVAALARGLNGLTAFTFEKDRKGRDDSGERIAEVLGIPCQVLDRDAWVTQRLAEVPFISCSGSVGDLAFKSAESLLRGSILLSGPFGDTVWGKKSLPESNIALGGGTMAGLTEYRLWTGFINCPIPLWGIRQINDIKRITYSSEMNPWDVGGHYSRPICRRVVESAGVPRSMFGAKKKGMSVVPRTRRSYLSPSSLDDLLMWLDEREKQTETHSVKLPRPQVARLLDHILTPLALGTEVLVVTVRRRFGWLAPPINWLAEFLKRPYYHHNYLVHWAIDRAKRRYKEE